MQTVTPATKTTNARRYDVYFGQRDQAVLYVDDSVYTAVCRREGCSELLTYGECKSAGKPVHRGEKAVQVAAYVRKVFNRMNPITGETDVEVSKSPRTISLFRR